MDRTYIRPSSSGARQRDSDGPPGAARRPQQRARTASSPRPELGHRLGDLCTATAPAIHRGGWLGDVLDKMKSWLPYTPIAPYGKELDPENAHVELWKGKGPTGGDLGPYTVPKPKPEPPPQPDIPVPATGGMSLIGDLPVGGMMDPLAEPPESSGDVSDWGGLSSEPEAGPPVEGMLDPLAGG